MAERGRVRGDGVEGEVLRVSSSIPAPNGYENVREDEEDQEGDDGRHNEGLHMERISMRCGMEEATRQAAVP
jgi:hypothetical protein